MDDIVITVDHVSKNFVLPHEKVTSIKSAFTNIYHKKDKSREVQHALNDISFEIKKGEFFGIVGRNGSGKSTMLKILAGIYQPTKGRVTTVGKLVPFIELGVGFNPELTGRENVYLNGAMLGFSRKEVEAMYNDIVAFAELERFMDQKLKNYSSGMQVRLAFSMATRSEADILLVDEVLAVGDADFQRKCFDYFRKLKKNKKTVIFVSHDMSSIREYCDRGVLIENSQLIRSGTANAIADEYTKLFIPKQDKQEKNKNNNRTGDNRLRVKNIELNKKLTAQDKTVHITLTCIALSDLPDAKIGIKLKDPMDRPLLGTNTELGGVKIGALKEDEEFTISFSFQNLLNAGTYKLDVVAEDMTGGIHDWWIDAAEINVFKEQRTGYPIEPVIIVEKS